MVNRTGTGRAERDHPAVGSQRLDANVTNFVSCQRLHSSLSQFGLYVLKSRTGTEPGLFNAR